MPAREAVGGQLLEHVHQVGGGARPLDGGLDQHVQRSRAGPADPGHQPFPRETGGGQGQRGRQANPHRLGWEPGPAHRLHQRLKPALAEFLELFGDPQIDREIGHRAGQEGQDGEGQRGDQDIGLEEQHPVAALPPRRSLPGGGLPGPVEGPRNIPADSGCRLDFRFAPGLFWRRQRSPPIRLA